MIKGIAKSTRKTTRCITLVALVLTSGCSFHSSQWDAMLRLLRPAEIINRDQWLLSGAVGNISVYPIQLSDAIMFTDGQGIFLKFDGWNFVEMRGLRVPLSSAVIEKPRVTTFDYLVIDTFDRVAEGEKLPAEELRLSHDRDRIVYEVNCKAWQQAPIAGGALLSQLCSFDNQEIFTNSIWLDQSGNIRVIEAVLSPDVGKIRVAMRNL